MSTLKWTLSHRWSAVVGGIISFALTIVLFTTLPATFQPDQDQDSSTATIEMVPGTTLDDTKLVVRRVADFLGKQPDVESVYSRAFVGNGRVTAIFKEKKAKKSIDFERSLAPELAKIPDARVSFRSNNGWGGSGRDLTVTLGGDDPALLTA
ncbi:efflux RND transporter permease subunit, partial [Bradyrhizobium sp. Arg816]